MSGRKVPYHVLTSTTGERARNEEHRAALNAIGAGDLFFSGHDLIIHEFPVLDMNPERNMSEWHAGGYEGEETYLFGPDSHDWYLSLEHALLVERDRVSVISRVRNPNDAEPGPAPKVLVSAGFAGTYVWPVFRHWLGL